jgi:hypothetical protein
LRYRLSRRLRLSCPVRYIRQVDFKYPDNTIWLVRSHSTITEHRCTAWQEHAAGMTRARGNACLQSLCDQTSTCHNGIGVLRGIDAGVKQGQRISTHTGVEPMPNLMSCHLPARNIAGFMLVLSTSVCLYAH